MGTNHVLTITINALNGTIGAGSHTATATIESGPGNFVGGVNTCSYTGGAATASCTVTITSLVAGTTVVSATADIPVSGLTITRTTGTAANTAAGGSGNASKNWLKRPPTPSTVSQYSGMKIYRGTAVTDAATITGIAGLLTPTGTVKFFLCGPDPDLANNITAGGCTTGGTQIGTPAAGEDLNFLGQATSESTAPSQNNTDGKYCWRAEYSGDNTYLSASHTNATTECFEVASSTIIIKKVTKPTSSTQSFDFDANGTGYVDFALQDGQMNTQGGLNAGSYSAQELVPNGWVLTGIGGDPNAPYSCTVTGSGGSTGVGDLNTQTVTIDLKLGDTVTCVFENTSQGVTRTQGFWATHPELAEAAWFGGTAGGHTFDGVASVLGDTMLCAKNIDDLPKLMGGFWSNIAKESNGKTKRSPLEQARMQLLQQLLAAELNYSAFGTVPSGGVGTFAAWEAAYCGTNTKAIKTAQSQAASFNEAGDSGTFTPGMSANSKYAREIANIPFWDNTNA